jgi:hypothetical protein
MDARADVPPVTHSHAVDALANNAVFAPGHAQSYSHQDGRRKAQALELGQHL